MGRDVPTSIFLDYGADSQNCNLSDLNISERGMEFKSRWQFSIGTQLALVFAYPDLRGRTCRTEVEGIVVDCEAAGTGEFLHLLIFPEITPELKLAIRDLQQSRHDRRSLSLN